MGSGVLGSCLSCLGRPSGRVERMNREALNCPALSRKEDLKCSWKVAVGWKDMNGLQEP